MAFDFDKGIARIPRLIAVLGLAGSVVAAWFGGWSYAMAFLVGAIAAWLNFRLIERAVTRLGELALNEPAKARRASGVRMFIQFALLVLAGFVILRLSGFNLKAAMWGFLVCPAAVMLEIVYELLTYDHS